MESMPEQPQFLHLRRRSGHPLPSWNVGPASAVLIGISVVVALVSHLGSKEDILPYLFISSHPDGSLAEVLHGQLWRLLSPVFLHFGFMHLVFNMLWLKDLGTMIERCLGTRFFVRLFVVIGVLSNLGQFLFGGPFFGGMSGVVYGLLGFVWMKSRFDPRSGFFLHRQTVIMMIVWFFLCLAGVIGSVANAAHGVGLVVGIVWGFISAKAPTSRLDGL